MSNAFGRMMLLAALALMLSAASAGAQVAPGGADAATVYLSQCVQCAAGSGQCGVDIGSEVGYEFCFEVNIGGQSSCEVYGYPTWCIQHEWLKPANISPDGSRSVRPSQALALTSSELVRSCDGSILGRVYATGAVRAIRERTTSIAL